LVPGLAFAFAFIFAALPWFTQRYSWKPLVISFAVGLAITVGGVIFGFVPFPWTDIVVLLVAVSGGILLGRAIPKRFLPMFILLMVFSALDIAQTLLTSGGSPSTGTSASVSVSPFLYANFLIPPPVGRFNLGIFDVLLIAAIAEHWRRRKDSIVLAEIPGLACFAIAYLFVDLTSVGALPLIPFLTVGWLISEALMRWIPKQARIIIA
jgi:hypothetical protein